MAFKIQLLSDVAGFLKGTKSVEDALDEVADSLDEVARQTEQDAEKAAAILEQEFKAAFDSVKTEAKQAGRKVGDDLDDGAKKAGDGIQGLKEEAGQSAREMAASFDGSAESVADMAQEIAAQAGVAFGPWGAAAGVALGIGVGALTAHLQEIADKAAEVKEKAIELAGELDEVDGNPELVDWLDRIKTSLDEIVDTQEWFEFWQNDGGTTRFEKWNTDVKEFGVSWRDVTALMTGDSTALGNALASLDKTIADLDARQASWETGWGASGVEARNALARARDLRTGLIDEYNAVQQGTEYYQARSQALADLKAKQAAQTAATDAQADAERQAAEASADAQRASQRWSDALTGHLSVADEGLDRFVKDGKLNLAEWAKELRARAKDNEAVQDFSVTIAPKLSPEALAAFAELPAETQAQIARAYEDGSKKDRKKVVANLEAEAKVTSITLDTSAAQTAATATPIEVPTTIVTAGLPDDVRRAADEAQREANQRTNEIEFTTRIDTSELQRQVDRAAAAIRTPTIYATVKPKKEVP